MIFDSLKELDDRKLLHKSIVLWGMGVKTREVINWLRQNGYGKNILFIVDNFKYTFCEEYEGIRVLKPQILGELKKDSFMVLLSIYNNYVEDVWKQLAAYGITDIYNLEDLKMQFDNIRMRESGKMQSGKKYKIGYVPGV